MLSRPPLATSGPPAWTASLPFSLVGSMTPVHDPATDGVYLSDGWGTPFSSICVRRIALSDGSQELTVRIRTDVASVCIDEANDSLLVVASKRLIELDRRTGAERSRWQGRVPQNASCSALVQRRACLMNWAGPTLGIYDLTSGTCERKRIGSCAGLFVGEDGNLIVASGKEGYVSELVLATGELRRIATTGPFSSAAYARAAHRIVLGLEQPISGDPAPLAHVAKGAGCNTLAVLALASGKRFDCVVDRRFDDLWVSEDGRMAMIAEGDSLRRYEVREDRLVALDERHLQSGGRILSVIPGRSIVLCTDRNVERLELTAYAI